ncbi:MAG: hypothetical protein IPI07_17780 [Flavobacteriales bacterium]|nr:hypothetical protein [Flavobacteriales bacterium]
MRIRTILLAFALVIAAPGFTQNYNGFNYQAVIRNAAGDPLPNQAVGVRVQINPGIAAGYSETHSVTTDAHGLISLTMGQGTPEVGSVIPTFSRIGLDQQRDELHRVRGHHRRHQLCGSWRCRVQSRALRHARSYQRERCFRMVALGQRSEQHEHGQRGHRHHHSTSSCRWKPPAWMVSRRSATPTPTEHRKIEFYDDVEPLYPFLSIGKGNSGTGALPGSSHISSTNRLTLGTQGNPNLAIEPTGEMGFNAPSAALTTATFGGIGRSLSLLTGNGEDIVWDGGGTGEVILKNTGTLSGATAFQNASSVALMTLRNTGEVGIGTSSPGGPFETHKADGSFVVRSWAGSGSNVVVTDVVGPQQLPATAALLHGGQLELFRHRARCRRCLPHRIHR